MAAPFVKVTVSDQSIYANPAPTTIPLLFLATRSGKARPDGAGTALGTVEANKLRLITSQRELIQGYGNPVFVTSSGAPVHGDETNEYSLLAAHSALGLTNRAFVLRADIDLGALVPTNQEPVLPAPDGTYWMDQDAAVGGVFRFNGTNWIKIEDVTAPGANKFHVFTTNPTSGNGIDGDWGWNYANLDGTLMFRAGGTWYAASNANLQTVFGGTVNLHISATGPVGAQSGDFWYKTTSSSGGVNAMINRYRAVDGQWVSQVIIRQGMMPIPNEGTLWEDTNQINTNGRRPIYVGTGAQFIPLTMFVQAEAPVSEPETGTLWFDDNETDFALYVEGTDFGFGNQWVPIDTTTVSNPTATQKVISASPPQFPAQGAIWVDLSSADKIDAFPVIKKFVGTDWIDITGSVMIQDSDPLATAVANGTYWLNLGERKTRNTVKRYDPSFTAVEVVFNMGSYVVQAQTGNYWRPAVGPVFGRKAQRAAVVRALQASIVANEDIRSEAIYYQLLACPGYPEVYNEMLALNADNEETAFILTDPPKFMRPSGIATGREITLTEWMTNARNAATTGEDGFSSAGSPYAGIWYPWGIGTDLGGNDVFVPPSHVALRTLAYSDSVSAPWFAPAGFVRGRVDNVSSVGYLNNDGEYQPVILNKGMRNIAYDNRVNPIAFIPNKGLTVYGQKTLSPISSALDRINVARLVVKMRYDLMRLMEPFLFEQNDGITRRSAQIVTERYLAGLKSLRALYDYAVRCDENNNTPDRIDRNELWVDVAVKPVKAIEFIYVPITVLKTGDALPF